jgi:uncharacterized glyoxalase superfamily protein PhnB
VATKVVPMIHVPDVRAAAAWYAALGFTVTGTHEEDGEMDWASLRFGGGEVMFSEGGRASMAGRREVDLYVEVEEVDGLYERIKDRVGVVEGVHDTAYGMRELIVRDLNGFWVTFGQPLAGE